jgi:hypothetical protein
MSTAAKQAQHTPLPWLAEPRDGGALQIVFAGAIPGNRDAVCYLADGTESERTANAAFISRACNNHEMLMTALRACVYCLGMLPSTQQIGTGEYNVYNVARAALKEAEE